jgi:hypothetical protein
MIIHGKDYTEVRDRIPQFLASYPEGSILTEVFWHSADFDKVCIMATVKTKEVGGQMFTGLAYEERDNNVNQVNGTSWVENCETSAIGRALANMNIGVTQNRPSAEEMRKVERMKEQPKTTPEGKKDIFDDSELKKKAIQAINKCKTVEELAKVETRVFDYLSTGDILQTTADELNSLIKEKIKGLK